MNLTPDRIRQIREVILERRAEDERRDLRTREAEVRILAANIRAAAGDKAGAKAAAQIELVKPPKDATQKKRVRYFPAEKANSVFSAV